MKHRDGYFVGPADAGIYHQNWSPSGQARAGIILVHGLAEHSGRYENLITPFVSQGFAIYGLDHIGHGRSDGPRVYVRQFSDYIDTLAAYVGEVRQSLDGRPLFLYGHSVGALITSIFLIDHSPPVSGVVFSGPCVKVPSSVSGATIVMAKILSRLAPKLGISAVDPCGVSRDPAQVQAYIDDPLVYNGKTTARLGCELLKAMHRIPTEASTISVPALIVQGEADVIVDPEAATLLHSAIGSADKTLTVYQDLFHEIHNEPEHPQVVADVLLWLEEHL